MKTSDKYLNFIIRKHAPLLNEEGFKFGDIVFITGGEAVFDDEELEEAMQQGERGLQNNLTIMQTGNRSLQRSPSDEWLKILTNYSINRGDPKLGWGKVIDVYENGHVEVKFHDRKIKVKPEWITKVPDKIIQFFKGRENVQEAKLSDTEQEHSEEKKYTFDELFNIFEGKGIKLRNETTSEYGTRYWTEYKIDRKIYFGYIPRLSKFFNAEIFSFPRLNNDRYSNGILKSFLEFLNKYGLDVKFVVDDDINHTGSGSGLGFIKYKTSFTNESKLSDTEEEHSEEEAPLEEIIKEAGKLNLGNGVAHYIYSKERALDKNPEMYRKYRINTIPDFLFYSPNDNSNYPGKKFIKKFFDDENFGTFNIYDIDEYMNSFNNVKKFTKKYNIKWIFIGIKGTESGLPMALRGTSTFLNEAKLEDAGEEHSEEIKPEDYMKIFKKEFPDLEEDIHPIKKGSNILYHLEDIPGILFYFGRTSRINGKFICDDNLCKDPKPWFGKFMFDSRGFQKKLIDFGKKYNLDFKFIADKPVPDGNTSGLYPVILKQ